LASAFGHAFAAIAISAGFPGRIQTRKIIIAGVLCSILPDADVIAFAFDIPYGSFFGHRGFTHSLLFAVLVALGVTRLFFHEDITGRLGSRLALYLFACTASHSLLDAMTSGGLGVAFFSPFDNGRYFLPWTPIRVSPIGALSFFSAKGIAVLKSEFIWIGIPGIVFILIMRFIKTK